MNHQSCDSNRAIEIFASQLRTCVEYNQMELAPERNNLVMLLLSSTSRGIDFKTKITAKPVYLGSFTNEQSKEYLTEKLKVNEKWFSVKNFEKIRNGVSNIPALLELFKNFQLPPGGDASSLKIKLQSLVSRIEDEIVSRYFSSGDYQLSQDSFMKLISIIYNGIAVSENTIIGTTSEGNIVTVNTLAGSGIIILFPNKIQSELKSYRIFIPLALFSKLISEGVNINKKLVNMFQFPYDLKDHSGKLFQDHFCLSLQLHIENNCKTSNIGELFGLNENDKLNNKFYEMKCFTGMKKSLIKEEYQFIYTKPSNKKTPLAEGDIEPFGGNIIVRNSSFHKTTGNLFFDDSDDSDECPEHLFENCIVQVAPSTQYIDFRMLLNSTSIHKKPYLIVGQLKDVIKPKKNKFLESFNACMKILIEVYGASYNIIFVFALPNPLINTWREDLDKSCNAFNDQHANLKLNVSVLILSGEELKTFVPMVSQQVNLISNFTHIIIVCIC